jgi:hypothetical protein
MRIFEERVNTTERRLLAAAAASAMTVSGDGRVSEVDAAQLLGVHADTLRKWRTAGEGPDHFRIGGAISYSLTDLAGYIVTCRISAAGIRG